MGYSRVVSGRSASWQITERGTGVDYPNDKGLLLISLVNEIHGPIDAFAFCTACITNAVRATHMFGHEPSDLSRMGRKHEM
jgi:hypothetical protein